MILSGNLGSRQRIAFEAGRILFLREVVTSCVDLQLREAEVLEVEGVDVCRALRCGRADELDKEMSRDGSTQELVEVKRRCAECLLVTPDPIETVESILFDQ